MKYMQNGGYQSQALMRLTIGLTLVFLTLFTGTSFALYFSKMSLDPASVVTYYLGSEEEFIPARSAASMLEVSHGHLAMMALVLLMLTHLLLFAPFSRRVKVAFVSAAFASGLLSEASGWLVRFVDPAFAPLKVAGFLGLQANLMFLLSSLALFLWRARSAGSPGAKSSPVRPWATIDPMLPRLLATTGNPTSGATGSAQVLWKEAGTGLKWALVRLNSPLAGTLANPATLGSAAEGLETATLNTWTRDGTTSGSNYAGVPLDLWMVSRVVYNDLGDKCLYAYLRKLSFDSLGLFCAVSSESRIVVDAPELCS